MPDRWARLWAPHRMEYLKGENRPLSENAVECPFCRIPKLSDEEGLIVARGENAYVVMNLYPYNAGHLLICANRHVADLTDLTKDERDEISELTAHAMVTLRKVSAPAGFNLGHESRRYLWRGCGRTYPSACCASLGRRCKLHAINWPDQSYASAVIADAC